MPGPPLVRQRTSRLGDCCFLQAPSRPGFGAHGTGGHAGASGCRCSLVLPLRSSREGLVTLGRLRSWVGRRGRPAWLLRPTPVTAFRPTSSSVPSGCILTLSYRDVEDLLAERGIEVSYETVRRWVLTFGPVIARGLRARRPKPHGRWHLDEIRPHWRSTDVPVARGRRGGRGPGRAGAGQADKAAAWKLMRKLLKNRGSPDRVGHGQYRVYDRC